MKRFFVVLESMSNSLNISEHLFVHTGWRASRPNERERKTFVEPIDPDIAIDIKSDVLTFHLVHIEDAIRFSRKLQLCQCVGTAANMLIYSHIYLSSLITEYATG